MHASNYNVSKQPPKQLSLMSLKSLKDFTIVWHIAWNKRVATINVS
jgi:hypothetical protein